MDMVEAFLDARSRRPVAVPHRRLRVRTDDGTDLLLGVFEQQAQPTADVLLFFHGAGGHMAAGYVDLGQAIHETSRAAVILPDLRGHGRSSGARGSVDRRERIWADLDAMIDMVCTRYPRARIHLGGHSLGASLCLNWLSRSEAAVKDRVHSLTLLAPYTGRAEVDRPIPPGAQAFVRRADDSSPGSEPGAVVFNYPAAVAAAAGLVCRYDREMFGALAPFDFAGQLRGVAGRATVLAARDDELFCVNALKDFVAFTDESRFSVVEGGHLTCLYSAHVAIGRTLLRLAH